MDTKDPKTTIKYKRTKKVARSFLRDMLYMALYVPKNKPSFPFSIIDNPELRKYFENFGSRRRDKAIIAIREKEFIGIVWGRLYSSSRPGYGFISEDIPEITLAVKPQYRNQGIGSALLSEICDYYKGKSTTAISLSVDKRSPAKALYKRAGFEYFSEKGNSVTMVKHLQ